MLLVNGCSYTYGDELESPETERWAYHLANSMGVELKCLAEGGSSNYKIYRDTMKFLQKHHTEEITQLIVMWSAFERVEVYDRQYNTNTDIPMVQMSPSRTRSSNEHIKKNRDSWESFYTDIFNTQTGIIHTLGYMTDLAWICHRLNIKLLQTWFHPHCVRVIDKFINSRPRTETDKKFIEHIRGDLEFLPDKSKIGYLDNNLTFDDFTIVNKLDLCPDGHPGPEAHREFSKYIGELL